ncbi:MAG: hypothetical protein KGS61_00800 [Verrucomicrobia bacterium]|nr:hypothetical protein [Verrucomicrobiota bacterium]
MKPAVIHSSFGRSFLVAAVPRQDSLKTVFTDAGFRSPVAEHPGARARTRRWWV